MFDDIQSHYMTLRHDDTPIDVTDYGAGSRLQRNRTIAEITKNASSKPWKGRQLYHLAKTLKANAILELGTNVGIGTAYLAAANTKAHVITVEGEKNLTAIAHRIHNDLNLDNISYHTGEFSAILPQVLNNLTHPIDLVYLDGNHRYEATLEYLALIQPSLASKGAIVIDDINWSDGMLLAWQTIIKSKWLTWSLNLGQYGIVFWDHNAVETAKHLTYIDYKYKPWKIGLFT